MFIMNGATGNGLQVGVEIRHLQLLVAIADEGTVTRAGARLHLTQSALSHQLRDAEERIGTALFVRTKRKMFPTKAGEHLLATARSVIAQLRQAERELKHATGMQEGSLRITTQCNTCYHWLPGLLRKFQKRFPSVDIEIDVQSTNRPLTALLEGRLDLAIVYEQSENSTLQFEPLFQDELVVIAAPNHRFARRAFIRPQDLGEETLITYSVPPETSLLFREVLNPAGVRPQRTMWLQLTESIIGMVESGLGVGVMAKWAVQPQLAAGTLACTRLTRSGLTRNWAAAFIRTKVVPSYITEFIALLSSQALPVRRQARRRWKRPGGPAPRPIVDGRQHYLQGA